MLKRTKFHLAMALIICLSLTACQNPGNDEPETQDNPNSPTNTIVGSWADNWQLFSFRADGTGFFCEEYWLFPSYHMEFCKFNYVYDEEKQTITVYFEDDPDHEVEPWILREVTNNYILVEMEVDEEEFETRKFIKQNSPRAIIYVEPKGQVEKSYSNNDRCEYNVESNAGSYYFDIEPVILWHENLPALTLESATAQYDPIQFNINDNYPYVLTVSFTENTTPNTKFSRIDLAFSNSNKSISVTCPIVIYQNPTK